MTQAGRGHTGAVTALRGRRSRSVTQSYTPAGALASAHSLVLSVCLCLYLCLSLCVFVCVTVIKEGKVMSLQGSGRAGEKLEGTEGLEMM